MNPLKLGMWSVALLILLFNQNAAIANAEPLFDQTKWVVLPAEAATTILKWYVPGHAWTTSEWEISSEVLGPLEVALASGLAKAGVGQTSSFKTQDFYRQYMPARWKRLHLIVVNGFYESASDMFPDKGIDPGQWKHELSTVFGGGCGFWRAIYVVEQNRLMVLQSHGGSRSTVICNGPK
jgi:dihydrofolate reductase